jgi:hypothetical protein
MYFKRLANSVPGLHECMRACMYAWYACMHVCNKRLCVYVCMYVCMHACMCLGIVCEMHCLRWAISNQNRPVSCKPLPNKKALLLSSNAIIRSFGIKLVLFYARSLTRIIAKLKVNICYSTYALMHAHIHTLMISHICMRNTLTCVCMYVCIHTHSEYVYVSVYTYKSKTDPDLVYMYPHVCVCMYMCWHTLAHSRIVRTANESSWHSCLNRYKHTHTYIYIETLQHYDVCTDACLHAFLGPYSPFCMCLRTYVHAYVHTCLSMWYLHHIHTVVGSCICTQPLWCVRACMHACLHTYIHRCMHRSAYITCVHTYMHAHAIYIHTYIHTYIYVHTHTHTHAHIHSQKI